MAKSSKRKQPELQEPRPSIFKAFAADASIGQPHTYDGSDCNILLWVRGIIGFRPGTRVQTLLGPAPALFNTGSRKLSFMKVIEESVDFRYSSLGRKEGIKTLLFELVYDTIMNQVRGCYLDFVVHYEPGFVELLESDYYPLKLGTEPEGKSELAVKAIKIPLPPANDSGTTECKDTEIYSPSDQLSVISLESESELLESESEKSESESEESESESLEDSIKGETASDEDDILNGPEYGDESLDESLLFGGGGVGCPT